MKNQKNMKAKRKKLISMFQKDLVSVGLPDCVFQ
jgi:hypothetical protein